MADLREALRERVRSLEPEPGGFERVVRRRRRKEVRRKVGAYAIVVALVASGVAGAIVLRHQQRSIPTITPDNISTLHQVWSGHAGTSTPSAATIADGMVFVAADRLYAFPLACAAQDGNCAPTWTGDLAGASSDRPVVADGIVVATSPAGLVAFDERCGGPTCAPLWTAPSPPKRSSREWIGAYSVPVVRQGLVYAAGGEGLYVFPLTCRTDGGVCSPDWVGIGNGSTASPTLGDGAVYVGSHLGLEAYPLTCSRARCDRLWLLGPESSTRHASGPQGYLITYDPKVTAAGADLFVSGDTAPLARYRVAPSEPSFDRKWTSELPLPTPKDPAGAYFHAEAVVANGVAYAPATRVYAFRVDCAPVGGRCVPLWMSPRQFDDEIQQYRSWSDPVVSNGLVFASTDRPYAFKVDCATGGAECQPLWVGPSGFASQPAVSDTAVAVTYVDGRVVLFEASGS
jgi:outer membrane protein assembly factor BamB